MNSGQFRSRDHFSSVASKKDSYLDVPVTKYDASNKIDRINLREIHDKRNTIQTSPYAFRNSQKKFNE